MFKLLGGFCLVIGLRLDHLVILLLLISNSIPLLSKKRALSPFKCTDYCFMVQHVACTGHYSVYVENTSFYIHMYYK